MKYSTEELINLIYSIVDREEVVKATISDMKGSYPYKKILLKPITIKNSFFIQLEQFKDNKAYHSNLSKDEFKVLIPTILENFKQFLIQTLDSEMQILKNKNSFNVKIKSTEKKSLNLNHNKKKNYILEENTAIPFFNQIGNNEFRRKSSKR